MKGPRILVLDIETSPLEVYSWGIWDQNIGINQIKHDWYILCWAAKFLGEKKIYSMDQSKAKKLRNDKKIVKGIWKLMDKADIILTQNGKQFDAKKLNARFIINGLQPPSSYKHIDTKILAKKHFGFTSNSLEYMTDKLCTKYKKLKHNKFPGQELWTECLKGNKSAWREMIKYNKYDILSLEELYTKLIPWDNSVNFNQYYRGEDTVCTCGSTNFIRNGIYYTPVNQYQRYRCMDCGSELRDRINLNKKRKSLKVGTVR